MAGGIVSIASSGISDIMAPILGNEETQRAGDRALKQLRRDYAAARKAQAVASSDIAAATISRVAGSGAEVTSALSATGQGVIARNLAELERQYVERRDAIWEAQSRSRNALGITAGLTLGAGLPLQASQPLAGIITGSDPLTALNPAAGANAGSQIGALLPSGGGGATAQSGIHYGNSPSYNLPATGGPAAGPGTILGTRGSYSMYA